MTTESAARQPRWYQDAVIYELHVRAFQDSADDGVGDFLGLIQRLDYLQALGVTALWLLPFYPSPLKDDGYDIADYTAVHPAYGTLNDFKRFLAETHRRGLRVITELVLNHTSDQHPWFQRARHAVPGTSARDFYVWSDTPERYPEARVIFRDFESSNWSWDSVAGAYFWHRFYAHQPDLNYDNPAVREAVFEVVDFWFGLGVDGLRLDAVPYLHEAEGTSSENLGSTHAFLKELRRRVDARFPDRVLLAEANQWPEEAAAYFGAGDECHMAFHFPLMPRLFMAVRTEDRFPIVDILAQTPPIPDGCQWALFLRNHDELTLEMVTEEERLAMLRAFGRDPETRVNLGIRRRLAPLLGNNRRRIELMNALLFSLPGTPVLYYGDEIGMGDNVYLGDRNGVRTPMQWSADRNAGFSRAHPQRLFLPLIVDHEYHHETVHVEAQQQNPHSLLNWTKRLIALRNRYRVFGRGSLELLHPANPRVLAFVRRDDDECVLVVANLSRFAQGVELDLEPYWGLVPVEPFGRTAFWPIGEGPYPLTLGPHAFYWFALEPQPVASVATTAGRGETPVPVLATRGAWDGLVVGEARSALEAVLPEYLRAQRWFGGKARPILSTGFLDAVAVPYEGGHAYLTLVRVNYAAGDPETYVLPLAFVPDRPDGASGGPAEARIARVRRSDRDGAAGTLVDATWEDGFCLALLDAVARTRRRLKGAAGTVAGVRTPSFRAARGPVADLPRPAVVAEEQTNTSVVYGDRLILKLFRRVEAGVNPEWEIGRFLAERGFPHAPPLVGALEYRTGRDEPATVAVLHRFMPGAVDGWRHTLAALGEFDERALAAGSEAPTTPSPTAATLLDLARQEAPDSAAELIGPYLGWARRLGERTAELHRALAPETAAPDFAPWPLTPFARRSFYQSMRGLAGRVFPTLRRHAEAMPEPARRDAEWVLDREEAILDRFRAVYQRPIAAATIRGHGNFHLGQVLVAGDEIAIIDFEGEPERPLEERRLKRSPLRDVAGMLRSFQYAADAAVAMGKEDEQATVEEERSRREPWFRFWQLHVSAAFLRGYLGAADGAPFLPPDPADVATMLDAFLVEKAVYEIGHELDNRPDWVEIPLRGLRHLLEE